MIWKRGSDRVLLMVIAYSNLVYRSDMRVIIAYPFGMTARLSINGPAYSTYRDDFPIGGDSYSV
jgi:hypothetical protein